MTHRELMEICYKTPTDNCTRCHFRKECKAFRDKTDCELPDAYYKVLNIYFDAEIEVIE